MSENEIKTITIGRAPQNDIVLSNPSVSSKHAVFKIEKELITLEDVGSTNGTIVNGERINSIVVKQTDNIKMKAVTSRILGRNVSSIASY